MPENGTQPDESEQALLERLQAENGAAVQRLAAEGARQGLPNVIIPSTMGQWPLPLLEDLYERLFPGELVRLKIRVELDMKAAVTKADGDLRRSAITAGVGPLPSGVAATNVANVAFNGVRPMNSGPVQRG